MTATDLVCEFMPGAGPFDVAGDFYLALTGAATGRASTPDVSQLDIVGDIDVRIDLTLSDWTAPSASNYELIGKRVLSGNQKSWLLFLTDASRLIFRWSADGSTDIDAMSTTAVSPAASGRLAVRVTLDVDNGASGKTVTFYTAPSLTGPFTQLGSPVTTAGTTSIFNSTAPLEIGDVVGSGFLPAPEGRVHGAEVRNGIGGADLRANPDFGAQAAGATSFTDAAGRVWSVNSPASIVGFDWVDLSARLLSASWRVGRDNEFDQFPPGDCSLVLKNDDRQLDPEYTAGTWFGKLLPRVPVRLLSIASALDLPGSNGANASTPDHSSFNVTDLDVRAHLAMDDWTPGGFGQFICGQYAAPSNIAWSLGVSTAGNLQLNFSTNGSTVLTRTATVTTGFTDGSDHWVRATLDVNNGAAGHDVAFYTSTDGVSWTQLGTTVTTAGTVTLFNSTAPLEVGAVLFLAGQVRYIEVRNGIGGTVVANPEFTAPDPGTTSFKDRTGRTWTVNGTAVIALDPAHRTDEFYGFVESGWVQDYQPPAKADCRLRLIDMLGIINAESLPQTAYEAEVLADHPPAYWTLDESEGTQMADSSGNGFHGRYDNGILGRDPLIVGGGKAFEVPHVGDHRGIFKGQGLPINPPMTIEAWIKTPTDTASFKQIVRIQRENTPAPAVSIDIDRFGGDSPNGELHVNFGGSYEARGSTSIDDDATHHVVVTVAGLAASDVLLYVDGVLETKTNITGSSFGNWVSLLWWTVGNTANLSVGDFGIDGIIDEVAVYDRALSAERIAAHYLAGATAFDGELSGLRVGRVLDIVDLPESMRDIATGDTTVGPAIYAGQNAGTYLAGVVESEQGYLYVDHRNAGKVTFRGRYSRLTTTRSTASQATFTDADIAGALHYERDGLDVDPNSATGVVNIVDAEWRGGTEQVRADSSVARFGPQTRSIRTEAPTPSSAASAGNWLVNNYSEPQARVRGFKLNPAADKRLRQVARDLRISDRVTTVRHPQTVGSPTSNDLYLEGVSHMFESGVHWTAKVATSAANLGDWWIWGTSTWGETTRWG